MENQINNILNFCFENRYLLEKDEKNGILESIWIYMPFSEEEGVFNRIKELKDFMQANGFKYGSWANQKSKSFLINCKMGESDEYIACIFDKM